jgi:hypothetical protein
MDYHLTVEQKIQVVQEFYSCGRSPISTLRSLQTKHGLITSRQTIDNIIQNFTTYGSVSAPRGHRSRTVRTPETISAVQNLMIEAESHNESLSSRRAAEQLAISPSSAYLILTQDLQYHPYHPILIHHLSEDDPQLRMEFCETFMALQQQDHDFLDKIIWSDESFLSRVTSTGIIVSTGRPKIHQFSWKKIDLGPK